jgi:hypothetical protein
LDFGFSFFLRSTGPAFHAVPVSGFPSSSAKFYHRPAWYPRVTAPPDSIPELASASFAPSAADAPGDLGLGQTLRAPQVRRHPMARVAVPGLGALFLLAIMLSALSASYAVLEARDLDADGPFYLLLALQHGGFHAVQPARWSVQVLQQSFVYLAYQLGGTDLPTYGRLLTLGTQGWPLILTALCWFALPRKDKCWILGPFLNLALIIPMTSFIGIGEGMIASCLMWLLYILVEFRPGNWFASCVALGLTAAGLAFHEAAFPFMFGIALLALIHARHEQGFSAVSSLLIGLVAFAATIHLLYWVIYPQDSFERSAFLFGALIEFLITPQGPGFNLPAIAALAVAVCFMLASRPGKADGDARLVAACKISGFIFAVIAVLFLAIPQWIIIPHTYFAARGYPVLATTVMAAMTHFLRRSGWTVDRIAPAPVRLVLLAAIALQFLLQTVMTEQWSAYRQDLTQFLATRSGIIEWTSAADTLNPNLTPFRRHLVWSWSLQPLSIVLAAHNQVRAVVDARPGIMWKPYELHDPATLPLCAKGLDWAPFLKAIGVTPEAALARCATVH